VEDGVVDITVLPPFTTAPGAATITVLLICFVAAVLVPFVGNPLELMDDEFCAFAVLLTTPAIITEATTAALNMR
jgi:hypothetical protein